MMAFLQFTFSDPYHFFGVLVLMILVGTLLDNMVRNIAGAIARRKP